MMAGYSANTDQELAALLRQGDQHAFAEVFERYHSLLYIFAYKKIGDREEAKDMVHDLFAVIWEKHKESDISGLIESAFNTRYDPMFRNVLFST